MHAIAKVYKAPFSPRATLPLAVPLSHLHPSLDVYGGFANLPHLRTGSPELKCSEAQQGRESRMIFGEEYAPLDINNKAETSR